MGSDGQYAPGLSETGDGSDPPLASAPRTGASTTQHLDRATFSSLLDALSVPVALITRLTGELIYANQAFCSLFSLSSTAVGTRLAEAVPFFARERVRSAIDCAGRSGKVRMEGPHPLSDADQSSGHRLLELEVRPVPGGLALQVNDVSQLQAARHAQQELADKLDRTAEDLNHFAYAASHDLQEPLRMVISYTQLLTRRCQLRDDPQVELYSGYVIEGAKRMEHLLDDLLAYTESADDSRETDAHVDLNDVLRQVRDNLSERLAEVGATIECESPLPVVCATEIRMLQVFQNLLDNAIKYRGNDPLHVVIRAERQAKNWLFSVRDNGIGIDPRHALKIFAVFKRLHSSKIPGTGIGLAICTRIVESYGGQIWVESKPGQGANFLFTLPEA